MRILYDLFFAVFGVFYIPVLLLKGKMQRGFLQKIALLPDKVTGMDRPVWIHAVSVGEAVLAARVAAEIKNRFPDIPIVVSTTTQTGNDMARKSAGDVIDEIFYYPLDISVVVARVVRLINPRLYIMMETELWPNLLEELHLKGIPVVLANGRISDASFANYRRIRVITKHILRCIDRFCMRSERDAKRIEQLGAPADKVSVTGNVKFDPGGVSCDDGKIDKKCLGFDPGDEIIVAGSTHSPEEQAIITVYGELRKKQDNLKLVLAPRHVERASAVIKLAENAGLKCRRFSDVIGGEQPEREKYDVLLVDTIGHLKDLYSVATLVFIGGSLAKKGGQNPIEAARWEKTVIFGPHMSNFREVAEVFLENKAAVRVNDVREFRETLAGFLADPEKKKRIAENARRVIEENAGAVSRTVKQIEQYLR
jgi:3-deoxy-D-manno-octulosonic-acid transferase